MTQQISNNSSEKSSKPEQTTEVSTEQFELASPSPNLADVQRIQRKVSHNPKAAKPADILRLQRTIGNQQVMRLFGITPKASAVQRHAADEEQKIERTILQRHAPDEEQEVERMVVQRHAPDEEQEVERMIQRTYNTNTRHLGHRPPGTHISIQRHVQEKKSIALVQRVPPTTDQLNEKFERSAGAKFKIQIEALQAMAGAVDGGANSGIETAKGMIEGYSNMIVTKQGALEQATEDSVKKGIQAELNGFQQKIATFTEQKTRGETVKAELVAVQTDLERLAALGTEPTEKEEKELAAIKLKLEDLKQRVSEFLNRESSTAFNSGKQAFENVDKVIGNGFGGTMLTAIDEALSLLPSSHIGGNASLRSIGSGQGIGQASAYDYEDKTINMVRPNSPFGGQMSEWTYTSLSRGSSGQRALMDKGAMSDYAGIGSSTDLQFGNLNWRNNLPAFGRSVMGGKKTENSPHMGKLAKGSLVNWTIRHETGHAVDQQIQFTKKRGKLPMFGGWREYEGAAQIREVVEAMLSKAGGAVGFDTELDLGKTLGEVLVGVLEKDHEAAISELKNMNDDTNTPTAPTKAESRAFKKWLPTATQQQIAGMKAAIEWARVALAQPWMLPDGMADKLEVNGRVYQIDHYGNWVSYLAEARANALSSYQFSSPGEWFAEAYAAYYGADEEARKGLAPAVVSWFTTNLGGFGQTESGGSLTKNGTLGTIEEEVNENGMTANDEMPKDVSSAMKVAKVM